MTLLDHRGEPLTNGSMTTLKEVVENYDLVDVDSDQGFLIVSPKNALAEPDVIDAKPEIGKEYGYESGGTAFSEFELLDYLPGLGDIETTRKYAQMKTDAQVRSSLRIIKTPVLAARWFIDPATDTAKDQHIADFIWNNLTQWMSVSWPQFLTETLLMLDYGYYVFEKIFDTRPMTDYNGRRREMIYWRKFSARHPIEIYDFEYDDEGGPNGINFGFDNVFIPIDKLMVFTFDKEAGNMRGRSILRSAYKHWHFKENMYKIDAIQKERHGIGIPVIRLPAGYSKEDKLLAHKIGKNLRTNENAHVVLPPRWEVEFAELHRLHQIDALASASHHGQMLYENVLANFMLKAQGSELVQVHEGMFLRGTRFVAEIIRDVLNKYVIPQLVYWNWGVERYPSIRVRRLGDTTDWRTISFAMRNFAGMGALIPDEQLEEWIRGELDLPRRDPDTARDVGSPQQARVGPPRQSTTPGQGEATKAVGAPHAGVDRSGG